MYKNANIEIPNSDRRCFNVCRLYFFTWWIHIKVQEKTPEKMERHFTFQWFECQSELQFQ